LAYNLGRPPSIGEEHITARLPVNDSRDMSFALHHLKHRQIQSRIVSQIYYCRERGVSHEKQDQLITSLQAELDDWRTTLQDICPRDSNTAYPHRYVPTAYTTSNG
jgi:hypothetical protein